MLNVEARKIYSADHAMFRDSVRKFLDAEFVPHAESWERQRGIDRTFWLACGRAGFLCPTVPEAYGGLGLDFLYNAVFDEELGYYGAVSGTFVQSDITVEYICRYGTEDQKRRYLPGMVSGEIITAIAMTEPGGGSDVQAIRTTAMPDGDDYVINGSKIYISNGHLADVIILAAKTDPTLGGKGISLILVETDQPGFVRGRKLDKIGQHMSDTSELFFNEVRVPRSNLLGEENRGFGYMLTQLPQERLSVAILSQSASQRAFDEVLAFTKDRSAFGQRVFDFQNSRFVLARLAAQLQVGWAHLDWALQRHVDGELTAAEAAALKYWHTEAHCAIVDDALQLHGGAGYMNEYLIARLWRDARVQRIVGGTSEIMLELVGRTL